MTDQATPAKVRLTDGLGPLPAGLLTVDSPPGIAHAGGMRRYEPIQALPDGEYPLYTLAALDAAVAAERERLRVLVQAVRDANRDAEDPDTFRLLKPGQERAWLALLAGLEGPNY